MTWLDEDRVRWINSRLWLDLTCLDLPCLTFRFEYNRVSEGCSLWRDRDDGEREHFEKILLEKKDG